MWLSIVAIVALVVVLLIVALIMIILLTPITYSIEWNGRTPYRAELSVKWLWRVLSLHLAYFQGKPFFKQLYVLGMQKIGPVKEYDDWIAQRVDDEYQKAMDEIDKDPMTAQAEAMMKAMQGGGQGGTEPTEPTTVGTSGESLDSVRSAGQASASQEKQVRIERVDESTDENKGAEARAAQYDAIRDNPTMKPDDEVVEKVTFNSDGTVKEKVFTKFDGLKDSVKARFQKPDPNDPVASFKSQIPTFWFMKHVTNTELWRQLLLVSKRCYDHSKPRDIAVEGRIGIGDPFKGGMLASMLYSIWPELAENIEIDYLNWHLEGSGHIKGRIILGVLAWHGTRFVLSQPMRALIVEAIKVFRVKRKENKELERLKAEQAANA